MTILQVAGEDESWNILDGSVSTDVNYRRAAYARCSLHANSENGLQIIFSGDLKAYLDAQPSGDKDFWFGYRFRGGGGFLTSLVGLKLYDSTDKCFMRLFGFTPGSQGMQTSDDGSFGGSHLSSYPSSDTVQGSDAGNPNEWTFRVKIHPTLGAIYWYVNGSFWFATPLGNTASLCTGSPKKLIFGCPNSNGNSGYSEFIATSADQPRVGMSLATLAPSSDGLTGWVGGYTSINEITKDTSTQNTTGAAGTDVSYGVTDVPALSGSLVILALIVSGEYASSVGSPQNLFQFLRFSGTIYPGALKAVANVISLLQTIWQTSPVTSSTITEAEANSVEIGQESAA
jgi:hypothetical protein